MCDVTAICMFNFYGDFSAVWSAAKKLKTFMDTVYSVPYMVTFYVVCSISKNFLDTDSKRSDISFFIYFYLFKTSPKSNMIKYMQLIKTQNANDWIARRLSIAQYWTIKFAY